MGQKVHPYGFRLGTLYGWKSTWFDGRARTQLTVYSDDWKNGDYLISQLQDGADVYMFCHSPNNFAAPYLCRKIYSQVEKEVGLPPLPWSEVDNENYEQGQLF